jgi:hypothetical protein
MKSRELPEVPVSGFPARAVGAAAALATAADLAWQQPVGQYIHIAYN